MNIEQFTQKIREKFPNENYSIIYAGKNSYDNSKIKCLDCGKTIIINTGELFRTRRKILCKNCNFIRQDTLKNRQIIAKKLNNKASNVEFFMKKQSKNGNKGDMVRFTCNKCGKINEMFVGNLIKNNSNCDCCYCSGQKNKKDFIIFQQELNENYPNKFTLLSDYTNVKTNIRIKCNKCGFIRNVKPNILLRQGYCPKCSNNISLGENRIGKWLNENNIVFEQQKYFQDWNIGIHYFDFYLPNYNMVIEFQGKQHYQYIEFFHKSKENFNYRKQKDEQKKCSAIYNGLNYLSIKYTLYDKLDIILSKIFGSTTISQESRGKCLEIESFREEEDIVWT